jgi:hypothetical protein
MVPTEEKGPEVKVPSKDLSLSRGTNGSNPSPSSGESVANSIWAKESSC